MTCIPAQPRAVLPRCVRSPRTHIARACAIHCMLGERGVGGECRCLQRGRRYCTVAEAAPCGWQCLRYEREGKGGALLAGLGAVAALACVIRCNQGLGCDVKSWLVPSAEARTLLRKPDGKMYNRNCRSHPPDQAFMVQTREPARGSRCSLKLIGMTIEQSQVDINATTWHGSKVASTSPEKHLNPWLLDTRSNNFKIYPPGQVLR